MENDLTTVATMERKRTMLAIMFIGYLTSELCELNQEEVFIAWMEIDAMLRQPLQ